MPLHPKLVHLPIALAILMPVLSLGLLIAWAKDLLPRRTWIVAIALQAVLVGAGFLALRSGEADEERVEAVVAEAAIEAHEDAAKVFMGGAVAALVLMGAAGVARREGVARGLAAVAVLASVGVLALGYQVGQAGGELVYQHGAASAFTTAGPGAPAAAHREHDDD